MTILIFKQFLLSILVLLLLPLAVMAIPILGIYDYFFVEELKYPMIGIDSVYAFGDGRFQVSVEGLYDLSDCSCKDTSGVIVYDLYKYIDIGDGYAYIIGYYATSKYKSGGWVSYVDIKNCEMKFYDVSEGAPKYLILNYNTGELTTYLAWNDVSESDKAIFSQDLDWWCQFRNTCYEKEGADLY